MQYVKIIVWIYLKTNIERMIKMTIEKTVNGEEAVIKPIGWLDTETSQEFAAVLENLEADVKALTLDLSGLEYTSSAGLRQIVAAHKKMSGNLKLVNVSPEIMQVFKMTGFDKKLDIR